MSYAFVLIDVVQVVLEVVLLDEVHVVLEVVLLVVVHVVLEVLVDVVQVLEPDTLVDSLLEMEELCNVELARVLDAVDDEESTVEETPEGAILDGTVRHLVWDRVLYQALRRAPP